jgi:sulfatase maturation enzyme AslB (radical SAM superfamily)
MSEFYSCRYLEGGLSFSFGDARACAVVQNGRGRPILATLSDEEAISVPALIERKAEIRAENQRDGHSECKGCPHLKLQDWGPQNGMLDWIGITNYVICNVLCTYCWLNYADYSPMKDTKRRKAQKYQIGPVIDQVLDNGLLKQDAIIDWGGGGEPTLNPGFDHCFRRLHAHGATQWLHTNAVRFPTTAQDLTFEPGTLRILCSLDAGTRETYARIKQRDRFDRVVTNLRRYIARGAVVVPKYLMVDDNATQADAEAFVARVKDLGSKTVIVDIDHRFPDPKPHIIDALIVLRDLLVDARITCRFEAVGSNSVSAELRERMRTPQRA